MTSKTESITVMFFPPTAFLLFLLDEVFAFFAGAFFLAGLAGCNLPAWLEIFSTCLERATRDLDIDFNRSCNFFI
jgi:hypothetical protein